MRYRGRTLEELIEAHKQRAAQTHARDAAFASMELRERKTQAHIAEVLQEPEGATPQRKDRRSAKAATLIIECYDAAITRGKKPTYKEIAAQTGVSLATVCRTLKEQGRQSCFVPDAETVGLLRRGYDTLFSILDIAYFTGIPNYTVQSHFERFEKEGRKRPSGKQFVKMFGPTKEHPRLLLTYRLASQIYAAADSKSAAPECHPLLRTYALEHRKGEEQAIIAGLSAIHQRRFATPY